jgi:alkylation response protein AidB-like acyl-CoA dehydrogenase
MIDFGLSEDQEALQRAAREFLAAECPPALVRANAESGDGIPRGLYKKMAELGWMGLVVPEKLGGLGLSTIDLGARARRARARRRSRVRSCRRSS